MGASYNKMCPQVRRNDGGGEFTELFYLFDFIGKLRASRDVAQQLIHVQSSFTNELLVRIGQHWNA